jgi:hypothetical protein
MKAKTNSEFRLFGNANPGENSSVFSKRFKLNLQGNQGFIVPWQMAEKQFTEKLGERVRG